MLRRRNAPEVDGARWQSRPRLALALRSAIMLSPVAASISTGLLVARLLGDAPLWQFVPVVGSVCVTTSLLVERVVRRFLPLEALLRMTMLFPERAPSRLAVARLGRDRAEQRRLLTAQTGAQEVAHVMLSLVTALGRHDKRTRGHSERVRMLTELFAEQLGLAQADRDRLRWAALLHDVGKLEIPALIISKPGPLDASEWQAMREHPTHGARLAGPFLDWLGPWAGGISHHHERWDGAGYPAGLAGEDISRAGRIVAVVDAFETMTAARSYKRAGGTRGALAELARCSGAQFDPAVVRQFLCIPVPRLWWATGPLGLLVQVPVIGSAQQSALQVGAAVTASAGSTVAAAGTAAVVGVGSAIGVTATAPPPAAAQVVHDEAPGGLSGQSPSGLDVPGAQDYTGPAVPAPRTPGDAQPTPSRTAADRNTGGPSTVPTPRTSSGPTPPPTTSAPPRVQPAPVGPTVPQGGPTAAPTRPDAAPTRPSAAPTRPDAAPPPPTTAAPGPNQPTAGRPEAPVPPPPPAAPATTTAAPAQAPAPPAVPEARPATAPGELATDTRAGAPVALLEPAGSNSR